MNVIINDNNISKEDVSKFGNKSRAILLRDNKILISHYGGVILLPGGSIDNGETEEQCIIRELKEEIGIDYDIDSLKKVLILEYFQPNYPTRDNKVINRFITTHYYLGDYRGININNTSMTEKEIGDNFHLQLIGINELEQLLNDKGSNPRKEYFDREMKEVIKVLKLKK